MRTWLNKIDQLMVSLFHWYGIYIKSSTEAYFKLQLTFLVRVFINKMIKKKLGNLAWIFAVCEYVRGDDSDQIKFLSGKTEHGLRASPPSNASELGILELRSPSIASPRREIDVPRKLVVSTLAPHRLRYGVWIPTFSIPQTVIG